MADAGIVRNRAKILAALQNAQATRRASGRREASTRSSGPIDRRRRRRLERSREMHAQTPASGRSRRDLQRNGFAFVGPTTAWALMQAIGLVDDHLVGCHRRGAAGVHTRNE